MKIANAFHYSLRWLYKFIAILLVVFAVLLSCLRLFLPYADNFRDEIQEYVNTQYQMNVEIGALASDWGDTGPTFSGKDIALINDNGSDIFIGGFTLEVNFWQSLKQQQFVTQNIKISNANISIDLTNTEKSSRKQESQLVDRLSNLFLNQIPHITLLNSKLNIQDENHLHAFIIPELVWLNSGIRHQGKGEVIVDGLSTNTLNLLVDVETNKLNELSGQVYFEANHINITPWIESFLAIEDEQTKSDINFKTWLDIKDNVATQLSVSFDENILAWQNNESIGSSDTSTFEQQLRIEQGDIVIRYLPNEDTYRYHTSSVVWQVNEQDKQYLSIDGAIQKGNINGYISSLDIASISQLSPLFIKNNNTQGIISGVAAQGEVKELQFALGEKLQLTVDFSDIQLSHYQTIPGIENLSGKLALQEKQLSLSLLATQGKLSVNNQLKRPIPYDEISASIFADFSTDTFIDISDIIFTSSELQIEGGMAVDIPADNDVQLAVLLNVDEIDGAALKHYYPYKIMKKETLTFLERSITDGTINHADIIFDGYVKDFPFNGKKEHERPGLFVVDAQLQNSTFKFSPLWPAIEQAYANVNYTNETLTVNAHSGDLLGLDVSHVSAELIKSDLTLDIKMVEQNPEHVRALMNASTLKKSVGNVLDKLMIEAPVSGHIAVDLPLKDVDKTVAKGAIQFSNNRFNLKVPNMTMTDVNGELVFTNELLSIDGMTLNWRDKPALVNLVGGYKNSSYQVDLDFSGVWKDKVWQQEFPEILQPYAQGDFAWQGGLTLYTPKEGDFSYTFSLASELNDLALLLPAPYAKQGNEKARFSADVVGDITSSTIDVKYNEVMAFQGVLSHQAVQLTQTHLALGQEKIHLPESGFTISGAFDAMDVQEWQPFITDFVLSLPAKKDASEPPSLLAAPSDITIKTDVLTVFNETLNQSVFTMTNLSDAWLMHLKANETEGETRLYPDYKERGLDITLDFLTLGEAHVIDVIDDLTTDSLTIDSVQKEPLKSEGLDDVIATTPSDSVDESIDTDNVIDHALNRAVFNAIPPIRLQCVACIIDGFDFGEVNIELAKPDNSTIDIVSLTTQRKGLSSELSGQWRMSDSLSTTQLLGHIDIKSIENEMNQAGLDSIIKDSGATLDFDINWLGSVSDFSLANLNGEVKSRLDDGYLSKVEDQARIFSILSLQSLVRKLTLDFRDVFSDGMFYSEITGDAMIDHGTIYTDNMEMKGAAGDLQVKGNTNLVTGALDYRMSYKPNLTSSLPVLAWVATLNPIAIIAGLAIDEVITSQVVSEFNFELTGTIDEPDFQEINRENKNISVGRSVPPTIIENDTEVNILPKTVNEAVITE